MGFGKPIDNGQGLGQNNLAESLKLARLRGENSRLEAPQRGLQSIAAKLRHGGASQTGQHPPCLSNQLVSFHTLFVPAPNGITFLPPAAHQIGAHVHERTAAIASNKMVSADVEKPRFVAVPAPDIAEGLAHKEVTDCTAHNFAGHITARTLWIVLAHLHRLQLNHSYGGSSGETNRHK